MVPGHPPQTPGCCVLAVTQPASQVLQKLNRVCPRLQGPPGPKGEQGDTVVIDYDGRILDAHKVSCFLGVAGGAEALGCFSFLSS